MQEGEKKHFFERKRLTYIIFLVCSLVSAFWICSKLAEGARWSSGLPLGGCDNFLFENGSLYTVAENGFTPGSSYFPGIVLLSLFFRYVIGYGAETAIIIFGALVGLFFLGGTSLIASDNRTSRKCLFGVSFLFLILGFPYARYYLLEMHPDIPSLMCFLVGVIFVDAFIKRKKKITLIPIIICFWFSALFKQNALVLYIGLGLYILLTKSIPKRDKFFILTSEIISGFLTLAVVFSIDGCFFNCVTVNSLHSMLSLKEYLIFTLSTLKDNTLFIICTVLFFVFAITKKIKIERNVEKLWLYPAVSWVVFCMYGSAKEGANQGNMEAAIIALLPFVLILIEKFYSYFLSLFNFNKLTNDLNDNILLKKILSSFILVFLVFFICFIGINSGKKISTYFQRLEKQKEFSIWLTQNFKEKNVAYNTITYEILNYADIKKKTDLYTVLVWNMAGLLSDKQLKEISEKEAWDVIITGKGLDDAMFPLTFENFHKIDQSQYPDMTKFYGFPIEIFVR